MDTKNMEEVAYTMAVPNSCPPLSSWDLENLTAILKKLPSRLIRIEVSAAMLKRMKNSVYSIPREPDYFFSGVPVKVVPYIKKVRMYYSDEQVRCSSKNMFLIWADKSRVDRFEWNC